MLVAECPELFIGDQQGLRITLASVMAYGRRRCSVFILDENNLEAFPTERRKFCYSRCHVFVPVQLTYYGVQLKLDVEFQTPILNTKELRNVFASTASDLNISLFVENVATNSKNIHEGSVLLQPQTSDLGSVRNN